MNDLRTAAQQALEALRELLPDERDPNCDGYDARDVRQWRATATALRAALAQQAEPVAYTTGHCENHKQKGGCQLHNLQCGWPDCDRKPSAALAQQAGKEALQVPPEVAATLTTTDLAWLETRRLTKLWQELGQMRWAGADEGWDRAIEAVRIRLNDECQAVLDWKATADQSQATAVELLRKMQGVKDG